MKRAHLGLLVGLIAVGCSSSSFEVASPPGEDTGEVDTGSVALDSDLPVDSSSETEGPDTSIVDSGAADSFVPVDSTMPDTRPPDTGTMPDTTVVDTGTVPIDSGTIDSGTIDSATIDSAPIDSGTIDSGTPDTIVAIDTAPPLCPVLTSALTEVWVDAASPHATPNGTSTCPFKTIQQAVAYVNTLPVAARTIRVRAGTYNEVGAVLLPTLTTLTGAGIGATTILGGGACMGIGNCIVRVAGGAILEQVTVDASPTAKHAIVTGGTDPGGFPILRNLKATGAVGDGNAGILTSSGSLIGPNVESSGNKLGLVVWGSQKTTISGGGNVFDNNTLHGINHEGVGVLSFKGGGRASGNGQDGIKFGEATSTVAPFHEVWGVIIKNNGGAGIRFLANAGGEVRNSSFLGNNWGILARYGASNTFDFGNATASGNNSFAVGTAANKIAGVCVANTPGTATPIVGNKFSACPVTPRPCTEVSRDAECETVSTYSDVWYLGTSAPDASSCSPP